MKKTALYLGLFTSLLVISCKGKEEKTVENNETKTIERVETVKTVQVQDTAAKNGTSVKINGNGVSLDSKDVDVEIKK